MSSRGAKEIIRSLNKKVEVAKNLLENINDREYAEKWTRKYINDLPNAAFAVVEKGYSEGKDKRSRHLPHHSKNVSSATENSTVDLAHYRNALVRVNQIKSVLGAEGSSVLRKRAASHLKKHRSVLKTEKAFFNTIEISLWEECEKLFDSNVRPLLSDNEVEGGKIIK